MYGYLGMVFVLLPKFDLAEELAGLVVDLQLAGREPFDSKPRIL